MKANINKPDVTNGDQHTQSFEIFTLKTVRENPFGKKSCGNKNKFVMIWIIDGHVRIRVENSTLHLSSAKLLFARLEQFKGVYISEDAVGYMLLFSPVLMELTEKDYAWIHYNTQQVLERSETIIIGTELLDDLHTIISCMVKEYSGNSLYKMEILKRYFRIFLIYLSREHDDIEELERRSRTEQIVENFMSLLDEQFRSKKMVADYAQALAVTPNYLNEVIKKMTGNPVGYHIRQRVIIEAKRQARYSDTSMKRIAYDLGFNDMSHFSKLFKNTAGLSFSAYKNGAGMLTADA